MRFVVLANSRHYRFTRHGLIPYRDFNIAIFRDKYIDAGAKFDHPESFATDGFIADVQVCHDAARYKSGDLLVEYFVGTCINADMRLFILE